MGGISRTHHSANCYRLDCGCITEFSSVHQPYSDNPRYSILCGNCDITVRIIARYPDALTSCCVTCRARVPDGRVTRVRCSRDKRHEGRHYDKTVDAEFDLPERLRSGKTGST